MSSYKDLLQQREQLDQQIARAREQEFQAVVADIRQKIHTYGISARDLGFSGDARKVKHRIGMHVAPKYRDPSTGATWSGRGKQPKWIANKNREIFLIQK